jgi:hypothetical protein
MNPKYRVESIPDHPRCFLITYQSGINGDDVLASMQEMVALAEGLPRPIYQIGDWRAVEGSFAMVVNITRKFPAMRQLNESAGVVGPLIINQITNPWLRLSRDFASKLPLGDLAVFESLEDALAYIAMKEKREAVSSTP